MIMNLNQIHKNPNLHQTEITTSWTKNSSQKQRISVKNIDLQSGSKYIENFAYFNVRKFRVQKILANQAIREISRVLMEFNFANQQNNSFRGNKFFAKLDFPRQKNW